MAVTTSDTGPGPTQGPEDAQKRTGIVPPRFQRDALDRDKLVRLFPAAGVQDAAKDEELAQIFKDRPDVLLQKMGDFVNPFSRPGNATHPQVINRLNEYAGDYANKTKSFPDGDSQERHNEELLACAYGSLAWWMRNAKLQEEDLKYWQKLWLRENKKSLKEATKNDPASSLVYGLVTDKPEKVDSRKARATKVSALRNSVYLGAMLLCLSSAPYSIMPALCMLSLIGNSGKGSFLIGDMHNIMERYGPYRGSKMSKGMRAMNATLGMISNPVDSLYRFKDLAQSRDEYRVGVSPVRDMQTSASAMAMIGAGVMATFVVSSGGLYLPLFMAQVMAGMAAPAFMFRAGQFGLSTYRYFMRASRRRERMMEKAKEMGMPQDGAGLGIDLKASAKLGAMGGASVMMNRMHYLIEQCLTDDPELAANIPDYVRQQAEVAKQTMDRLEERLDAANAAGARSGLLADAVADAVRDMNEEGFKLEDYIVNGAPHIDVHPPMLEDAAAKVAVEDLPKPADAVATIPADQDLPIIQPTNVLPPDSDDHDKGNRRAPGGNGGGNGGRQIPPGLNGRYGLTG